MTRIRRRSGPNSWAACSRLITPCAMLCNCWSPDSDVLSSSSSTVHLRDAKVMLQRQDLAPVAQRVLRQQPHFRQAVEHDAHRRLLVDLLHHALGRLAKLDFRRMENGLLAIRVEVHVVDQLEHRDAVERPAMAVGHRGQFLGGFRQRDVQPFFALFRAFQQELQRQRGLAGARRALDQVDPAGREAAAQDVVESGDAGGCPCFVGNGLRRACFSLHGRPVKALNIKEKV